MIKNPLQGGFCGNFYLGAKTHVQNGTRQFYAKSSQLLKNLPPPPELFRSVTRCLLKCSSRMLLTLMQDINQFFIEWFPIARP